MATSLHWKPIEDLPVDYDILADAELQSLVRVWDDQQAEIRHTPALNEFTSRLHRAWAIETGIIEQLYSLDRGITQLLIERGIDAALIPHSSTDKDPALVAAIIADHETAIEALFDFTARRRHLSAGYIKELHAVFTRNQSTSLGVDQLGIRRDVPLERGSYRSTVAMPSRPAGSDPMTFTPPEHIPAEMDRLVEMHQVHDELEIAPEIEAAWLHHRFTQIHPFQDGNGRVARALASLIYIRAGLFPLVITRDDRDVYISALERADAGDLGELVTLFAAKQRHALLRALNIADTVAQEEQVDQVIAAIGDVFEKRRASLRVQWERAKDTARELHLIARERIREVEGKLSAEVREHGLRFFSDDETNGGRHDHYHRWQIIEAAKTLDYFANTTVYRSWLRLKMIARGDAPGEILISFHGLGQEYRGLIAVSACFFRRGEAEEEGIRVSDFAVLSDKVFQINYVEEPERVRERFEAWLNRALVRGLDIWRRSL